MVSQYRTESRPYAFEANGRLHARTSGKRSPTYDIASGREGTHVMSNTIERMADGFQFLEAPAWDGFAGNLLVADLTAGGVWRIIDGGDSELVVPKRVGVGGMALHENGGIVLAGKDISWFKDGETAVLSNAAREAGLRRFNDIMTDAQGRLYAGSLDYDLSDMEKLPPPGYLHLLDLDGTTRTVADELLTTNGMGISPSGDFLYHIDSRRSTVWIYRHSDDGTLHDRRPFIEFPKGEPAPDGLAVAQDGTVWVARHQAGVSVIEPNGTVVRTISVPEGRVVSLCFGGAELDQVYMVTGGPYPGPDAGIVYRMHSDVPGVPVTLCRVPIPAIL
jgi:D-xylonolactonase